MRYINTEPMRLQNIANRLKRILNYNIYPKLCKYCQNPLPYEDHNLKEFCNSSCSASYNNKHRKRVKKNKKIKPQKLCIVCGKQTPSRKNKFCERDGLCDAIYNFNRIREAGKTPTKATVRRYLILTRGYKCEDCKLSEWKNTKIPLESHHIDGNYRNNKEENLKLLCPNCHSITDNYRGKNRNNGRKEYKHPRR
jgi:predicted nucleic acid-binding Zn ribbon protein